MVRIVLSAHVRVQGAGHNDQSKVVTRFATVM